MKYVLILALPMTTGTFIMPTSDVSAQTAPRAAQAPRTPQVRAAQVRTPAALRQRDRAVTIIKPADVHQSATLSIDAVNTPISPANSIQAPATPPNPPRPGVMGSIQAAPQGKLNITLTAKRPSVQNRAYLSYDYPQRVSINDNLNYIVYSSGNIPGSLSYSVKLQKDKRYLIEIMADPWGQSGGKVQHKIGDETTIHEFGTFNQQINISRVVQPSEDGWVGGWLAQSSPAASQWRVYSVKFSELD